MRVTGGFQLIGFLVVAALAAPTPASASVVSPTTTASFAPGGIQPAGVSTLTVTLTNPATNAVALTGLAFADTLPANLVIATPNGLSDTCGGSVTATAGTGAVSLAGGTVGADQSCVISVNVTGSFIGSYLDTTGPVSSTNGGTGASASATLAIANPPTTSTQFLPDTIPVGVPDALSITIVNPNSQSVPPDNDVTLTGVAVSDLLPAGLVVASPSNVSNSCGGTLTATPGAATVTLAGGTIAPASYNDNTGGACFISVEVTATTSGTLNDTTGPVTANESGAGTASNTATLTATPSPGSPTITQGFNALSIAQGNSAELSFTLTNTAAATLSFTDTLGGGLELSSPTGATGTCLSADGGTLGATAGSSSLQLIGVAFPAAGSCTLNVEVTDAAAGSATSSSSNLVADYGDGEDSYALVVGQSSLATLPVVAPPTLSLSFTSGSFTAGGTAVLTVTVRNPNTTASLSGVGFTDPLPSGLLVATPSGLGGTCSSPVAAAGSSSISLAGAALGPGSACTVTVAVTASASGTYLDLASAARSNEGGSGSPASASITVTATASSSPSGSTTPTPTPVALVPPTISESFSHSSIHLFQTTTLTFTITNPNASASLTGIGLTDALPGAVVATPSGLIDRWCGGTASIGDGETVSLAGGTLAAGMHCTLSLTVFAAATGTHTNTVEVTSLQGGSGISSSATLDVEAALVPASHVVGHPGGILSFDLTLPQGGIFELLETAWRSGTRLAFGSLDLRRVGRSTIGVTVTPDAHGRSLLASHQHPLRIRLSLFQRLERRSVRLFGFYELLRS